MKVRVYRNLHKKCFSVQEKTEKGWRVKRHATSIVLKNASFRVSEAGRKRVLKEKRKNVHAFIEGYEIKNSTQKHKCEVCVSYNPYKCDHFETNSHDPVFFARLAHVNLSGCKIHK